jgi:broad specificity phosphatase PhoE
MQTDYCTIYLVRHGEAEGNAKGILMGHMDLPLTEKGKSQAWGVGEKLKDVHFDAIYSSDLMRAKQTAEIIAKERDLIIQTSKLIRERTYGIHEGKPREKYLKDTQAFWEKLNELSEEERLKVEYPDGMESNASIMSRAITFLREVAVANPGKTVLVVAHGGIMANFLIEIGFAERGELAGPGTLDNGAFVKIESDGIDFMVKETSGVHKKPITPKTENISSY